VLRVVGPASHNAWIYFAWVLLVYCGFIHDLLV